MKLTQDQIKQVTTDDSRHYVLEINGVEHEFISVTSVINWLMNKPALPSWAFNIGIEETFGLVKGQLIQAVENDNVEEVVNAIIGRNWKDVKTYLKDQGRTHDDLKLSGADRGTILHTVWESMIKGEPLDKEMSALAEPYTKFTTQFVQFLKDYNPEFHDLEMKVVSFEHGYAGTLDAVATIRAHPERRRHASMVGKQVVIDWKSNDTGKIYPEIHLPQIDAYQEAYEEMEHECDGGMVIAFGKESYTPCLNYYPKGVFSKGILNAYNMLQEGKRMNPNARARTKQQRTTVNA